MPHDPALVAETRAWFSKAAEDLRAAEFEFGATPPLTADIAFHAQQAAEKAMKDFLTWHGQLFRKTHNLIELGEVCASLAPALEAILQGAAPLTEYAWKFRYPGELEELTPVETEAAFCTAREVYEALLDRLPTEVWP